jgi:hypothetical protein
VRAFVLAADVYGNGANVIMFPPAGTRKASEAEPLDHLVNPEVLPESREIAESAVEPGHTPCRTEARWKIDERGNAALVSWRTADACSGDGWTGAARAPEHRASASGRSAHGKRRSAVFTVHPRP